MGKRREYARTNTDIWNDDDFRALPPAAQHLYFVLSTDPTMNIAGVADWRPARIAAKAAGWSPASVYAAAEVLAERLFIVIDEETEEVLIRSQIKHDGVIRVPNSAASMCTAMAAVASPALRAVVVFELRKLKIKAPDLPGWTGANSAEKLREIMAREAMDPSTFPTRFPRGGDRLPVPENPQLRMPSEPMTDGYRYPSGTHTATQAQPVSEPMTYPVNRKPITNNQDQNLSAPAERATPEPVEAPASERPSTADVDAEFATWYAEYPLKKDRADALKAFRVVRKTVSLDELTSAARAYRDDPNRDPKFTKYPATWLRKGAYADKAPLPDRQQGPAGKPATRAEQNRDYAARRLAEIRGTGQTQLDGTQQLRLGA